MENERKRLRLTSCVNTIIEVHESLEADRFNPALSRKFHMLREALEAILLKEVSESDLERVEAATNRLLGELGRLYSTAGGLNPCQPRH